MPLVGGVLALFFHEFVFIKTLDIVDMDYATII